jgi:hypothetical protein
MTHRAVPVKVTCWVDEGVASLVEALNAFPAVVTLDSCENSESFGGAYVMFVAGGGALSTVQLVTGLAADLAGRLRNVPCRLRLDWFAGGDQPIGCLSCPHDVVQVVVGALRGLVSAHTNR